MIYHSTRNSALSVSSAEAIAQGISADGGLFVPAFIPELSAADFESLKGLTYYKGELTNSDHFPVFMQIEL